MKLNPPPPPTPSPTPPPGAVEVPIPRRPPAKSPEVFRVVRVRRRLRRVKRIRNRDGSLRYNRPPNAMPDF